MSAVSSENIPNGVRVVLGEKDRESLSRRTINRNEVKACQLLKKFLVKNSYDFVNSVPDDVPMALWFSNDSSPQKSIEVLESAGLVMSRRKVSQTNDLMNS